MFRCSECGCEYNQKPDFCECGNNIFEEFSTEKSAGEQSRHLAVNKSILISWLFFVVCIILSIIVILFFPNIKDNPKSSSVTKSVRTNQSIPDIKTLWIDSQPLPQPDENTKSEIIVQPKETKVIKQKINVEPEIKKKTNISKQQVVSASKPATTKPKTPTVGKSQPVTYSYEVINYRTALRQRLFSNLNLYKIEGSGTCGITFVIDENGKLTNRNFSFQSDNKTVNDEVYNMLMRTPKFTPPPSSYVNKQVKMIFKLSSDSYEIKFVD